MGLTLGELEALPQLHARDLGVARSPDELDHLVDVVDRDLEPFQDVLTLASPVEVVRGALDHDVVPMLYEMQQHLAQRHHPGDAVDQREHDGAERDLHLRMFVEPIQHDVRDRLAPELDHDPHPVTVGLVAQIPYVGDLPVTD